jgi:hypothetical protein
LTFVHQKKLQAMKTTDKKIKEFDTVQTFREIKDEISKDIQGMNFEQLNEYLNKTKLKQKLPDIKAEP